MPKNTANLRILEDGLSREQFRNRLSQYAKRLYGEPVSDRMLRNWCEQGFIIAPLKKGLGRGKGTIALWGLEQYKQACKLCRFRNKGVKSEDALRIMWWLSGQNVTFKHLRASCIRELQRLQSSKKMSPRSLIDPTQKNLSSRTIKSISKSVGQLDARLVPSFNYSDKEKVEMLASIKGGEIKTSFVTSLINATMPKLNDHVNMEQFASLFAGVFGETDEIENSGEELLQSAELGDFEKARELLLNVARVLKALPQLLEISQVGDQNIIDPQIFNLPLAALNQPEFKILYFLGFISAVQRNALPPEMEQFSKLLEQFAFIKSKNTA